MNSLAMSLEPSGFLHDLTWSPCSGAPPWASRMWVEGIVGRVGESRVVYLRYLKSTGSMNVGFDLASERSKWLLKG